MLLTLLHLCGDKCIRHMGVGVSTRISACLHCAGMCIHVCTYVHTCACVCTRVHVLYMYTCIHAHACVCVCVSVHVYTNGCAAHVHLYVSARLCSMHKYISTCYVHSITLRMSTAILCTHTFSACSNSATLAVECTRTFEPNTLILSVSIAVLAMRIRAFSMRFGWFTPTFFSRR